MCPGNHASTDDGAVLIACKTISWRFDVVAAEAGVSSPAAVVMTNWRADQTASDHPSGSS
jgi:hypothetical protein